MTLAHGRPVCGAKNRNGKPCKRLPTPGRTRCHMHGGKSLRGHDHPQYVHGYYSKTEKQNRRLIRQMIRDLKTLYMTTTGN